MRLEQRWNLPVYFQLRFQEIAGRLESTLLMNPLQNATLPSQQQGAEVVRSADAGAGTVDVEADAAYRLHATRNLVGCLQQCWSPRVHIGALSFRFWKLTLQVRCGPSIRPARLTVHR